MPMTNTYDVTYPPDTQQANLLGSDLRALALNVQQRMAAISGALVQRWNPALDAQPLNWTGLLFFASDTGQVFEWNGTAWIDVTFTFQKMPYNLVSINGSGSTTTGTVVLFNTLVTGLYRVSGYINLAVAGAAGSIQLTFNWSNGVLGGNGIVSAIPTTGSLGTDSNGTFMLQSSAGTSINYNIVVSGGAGCVYTYRMVVERLQ